MAIINPPAPLPLRNIRWRLREPFQVNRSAWTGRRHGIGTPGAAYWTVEATFRTVVREANAKAWRAWFVSLRGPANSFPVRATETQQTAASNPTVRSGAGSGTTVPLQGLPNSTTVLVAGDFLTVTLPSGHRRLVCLTANLNSNGSGQGTATFAPELGEVPAEGAAVEMQWPYALVALTSEPPGWDVDKGQQYSFTLSAEEAK